MNLEQTLSPFHFKKHKSSYFLFLPNIAYLKFLTLQTQLTEHLREDSKLKFFLFASHPSCLTMGRGDRQNSSDTTQTMISDDKQIYPIKRGGGLSFHHPDQWIFYPLLKLHPDRWPLTTHINWCMNLTKTLIEKNYGFKMQCQRNPLGIWYKGRKFASLGVGVERFITQHGLALNIDLDPHLTADLKSLNPCGLESSLYSSLKALDPKLEFDFEGFSLDALKLIRTGP